MAVTADMVERPGGKARHISYTLPAFECIEPPEPGSMAGLDSQRTM